MQWHAWVAAGAVLASNAAAQTNVAAGIVREGTLSFDGRATAGDFVGRTSTIRGALTAGAIGDVRGFVEAPVTTLVTGNGRRDRDLNKSMESARYPLIRFELQGVNGVAGQGPDSLAVELSGQFTIHGVTRAATIPGFVSISAEAVRFRGMTPLNLKDYQIGGLSKMLGVLKMHPDIVVHIDVTFTQDGASEPPPFPEPPTP
ncbi:MAG: YceI family protein [Gemmatimonadetes bacterium]|nr:YceI family protein [Gemmatimonadota bacterium]